MFKFLLAKKKLICATTLLGGGTAGVVIYSLRSNSENKEDLEEQINIPASPSVEKGGVFESKPGSPIKIDKFTIDTPAEGIPLRREKTTEVD